MNFRIIKQFSMFLTYLLLGFFLILKAANADNRISVIDTSAVVEKSAAYIKAKKVIEEQFTKSEKNASKVQERFVKKYEDLERKRSIISTKEYNKEKNNIDKEAQLEQKILYTQRVALNKELSSINQALESKLTEIIKELAEEYKISIVLNKAVTLYNNYSVDITDKVVSKANESLVSIDINLPNK